jgi:hypothetical protein
VAAFLPNDFVVQICESHELTGRPKLQEASGSSSYDDTAHEHFRRIWKLFASALHIFQAEFDGFANIGKRFGDRLTLRIAPRDRRASYDIPSVALIGLKEDFVVARDHGRIVSHRIDCHNDMWAKKQQLARCAGNEKGRIDCSIRPFLN